MNHDIEAAYATSEVADLIMTNQNHYFGSLGRKDAWSVFAGREGRSKWPLADGVISAENPECKIKIALEYKRPNEGVHGILTALGQSYAYLEKGYDASIMVIPNEYDTHNEPGQHINRIIDAVSPHAPISIYTYKDPDFNATNPFKGCLTLVRDIILSSCASITRKPHSTRKNKVSTLWAHMREGMSHPDAFFRYCQALKIISGYANAQLNVQLPAELHQAVNSIDPNTDIYKYLSNTNGDSISEKAWRYVWFNYYFWDGIMPIYKTKNPYEVNDVPTKILISDNSHAKLFSGRKNSIKTKLVDELNNGRISENDAWMSYAEAVRDESHSYREVIDSGLDHIGFVGPDGSLTELGYKYVDACEKIQSSYMGIPFEILRAAVIQNGQYGAMLHYIYNFSTEKFASDLYAFTENSNNQLKFNKLEYLYWLEDIFVNQLHLLKKTTLRADGTRRPFQAETTFLKKLGFVKETNGDIFRVGTGLNIDWQQVINSMIYTLSTN